MFSYWKGDDFRVSLRVSGSKKSSWSPSCSCPEVHRPMEIVVPRRGLMTQHLSKPITRHTTAQCCASWSPQGKFLKNFHVEQIWRQRKLRFFLAFNESWSFMIFDCEVLRSGILPKKNFSDHPSLVHKLAACWWCFLGCLRALSWQRGSLRWFQTMVA